jgi:two-component sensor histidine kinase
VGGFGSLGAEVATPLAMALTELLQNAVEHGFGPEGSGAIELRVDRTPDELRVAVVDDGRGVPDGFDIASGSLGLSIVSTLVGELGGSLRIARREDGNGTLAVLELPLSGD